MNKVILAFLPLLILGSVLHAQKSTSKTSSDYYTSLYSDFVTYSSISLKAIPNTSFSTARGSHVSYSEEIQFKGDQRILNSNYLTITIPFKGEKYDCFVKKVNLQSPEYSLKSSNGIENNSNSSYYRGIVLGQDNSWVTFAIINGDYRIVMATEEGNIQVVKNKGNKNYHIYKSKDLLEQKSLECLVEDQSAKVKSTSTRVGSDCLEVYIECDHQSYLDNSSSVANTEAWALAIMNDVATIYATIDIPIVVSEVFVWNTTDPYTSLDNAAEMRDTFVQQIEDNYTGRVAQLFSTRPLGQGLAYGLGGLCGNSTDYPGPYLVATSLDANYSAYPNYSFTIHVVAHELGHVFGAQHTHACVWGMDGNSQLDDCGNVYAFDNGDTPEGEECFDNTNPILPTGSGTIMSRCELTMTGVDLTNGFHPEVEAFIYEAYSMAPCSTGGLCASQTPPNDLCENAKNLPVNGVCDYRVYDNYSATASGVAAPSCGSIGTANDIWYTYQSTGDDLSLLVNTTNESLENLVVTVYTGSCGSLTENSCTEVFDEEISIKISGLSSGEIVYIRVIEEFSDAEGTFEMCLVNPNLPCHAAYDALIQFYNDANGGTWTDNSGWIDGELGTDCDVCSWFGITCDNLGNVIGIDLTGNNLSGTVAQELDELIFLRELKIWNNTLSGTFPDIWTNLTDLEHVDLSNNLFTGNMPNSLANLSKLEFLYIENNMMDGPLLPEIGNLEDIIVFWGKNNDFSGCFPGEYLQLCDAQSIQFTGNAQLPGGGDFSLFCSDGIGGDIDEDGYCFGSNLGDDCVDDDPTIYPSAPELCDGKDNDCDGDYDEDDDDDDDNNNNCVLCMTIFALHFSLNLTQVTPNG